MTTTSSRRRSTRPWRTTPHQAPGMYSRAPRSTTGVPGHRHRQLRKGGSPAAGLGGVQGRRRQDLPWLQRRHCPHGHGGRAPDVSATSTTTTAACAAGGRLRGAGVVASDVYARVCSYRQCWSSKCRGL
jgi:hypothetical protein